MPKAVRRRLFLSQITSDFNPEVDLVLGAWCFLETPKLLEEYHEDYPRPFKDTKDLERIESYLKYGIIPIVREAVSEVLIECWKGTIDAEADFFREIVDPWLTWLCQNYWILYLCLKYVERQYKDIPLVIICHEKSDIPVFKDTSDFARLIHTSPSVQGWVASRLVEIMGKNNTWTLVYPPRGVSTENNSSKSEKANDTATPVARHNWLEYIRFQKNRLRCSSRELPFSLLLAINILLIFKPFIGKAPPIHRKHAATQPQLNDKPNAMLEDERILENLIYIAIQTVPAFFTQKLSFHWRDINRLKFKNGKWRVSSSDIFDDKLRVINWLARRKGEFTIGIQHGGGYGCHRVFPLSPETEYLNSMFVSWGWTSHGNYNVNAWPLPSPQLSKIADKHRPQKKSLLFVNYALQPLVLRFHSKPLGSDLAEEMKRTETFITALDDNIKTQFIYRPHVRTASFEDPDRLISQHPEIRVLMDAEKAFQKELFSCRLLVINHPITVLHIAMAANVPMVCYWDPEFWAITDPCEELFGALRRAGVIFNSPKEAAIKVNEIWADVQSWWNGQAIQSARQRWATAYALTDRKWRKTWLNTLWRL